MRTSSGHDKRNLVLVVPGYALGGRARSGSKFQDARDGLAMRQFEFGTDGQVRFSNEFHAGIIRSGQGKRSLFNAALLEKHRLGHVF